MTGCDEVNSDALRSMPLDSIICGDNVATMATFPDASIDLVVTSPPYDNLRTYGGHLWNFEDVAAELWRVIKPGGVVVWVVADATVDGSETGTSFRQALRFMEIGFRLHDTMIYRKEGQPPLNHCRYEQSFEFMFVLSKGSLGTWNPLKDKAIHAGEKDSGTRRNGGRDELQATHGRGRTYSEFKVRGNVWTYGVGFNKTTRDKIAYLQPAIFPEDLARDHILSWSNESDIVLDPFNGSGTTTKMARLMGRRFIGIEVNEAYCKIARKRIAQKLLEF